MNKLLVRHLITVSVASGCSIVAFKKFLKDINLKPGYHTEHDIDEREIEPDINFDEEYDED